MTHIDLPLLNQQQAARLAGVSGRTFRDWGLTPAERRGRSPFYSIERVLAEKERRELADNNSARSRRGAPLEPRIAVNIFRRLLEQYHGLSCQALGHGWRGWLDDGDWRQIEGLTEDQARVIAWKAFLFSGFMLSVYLTETFEKHFKRQEAMDLDGLMRLFFGREVSTAWSEVGVATPEPILELMPAEVRDRLNGHG